jgi:hypothetical protein
MLQIIGWMLCAYMILKAIEFILIARAAPGESRSGSLVIAALGAALAVIMAFAFATMVNDQARSSPSPSSLGTPSFP